jgi:DNA-directed RNA polymerase sigma subunit (sigma70/sigma32)
MARLTAANNPEMTDAEIAEKMDLPVPRVRAARRAAQVTASLDAQHRGDGAGASEYELIPDRDADDPAEVSGGDDAVVREHVSELPEEVRCVIEMRFGLNGYSGKEHTQNEIAEALGLSMGRVGVLERAGLQLLRNALA